MVPKVCKQRMWKQATPLTVILEAPGWRGGFSGVLEVSQAQTVLGDEVLLSW